MKISEDLLYYLTTAFNKSLKDYGCNTTIIVPVIDTYIGELHNWFNQARILSVDDYKVPINNCEGVWPMEISNNGNVTFSIDYVKTK